VKGTNCIGCHQSINRVGAARVERGVWRVVDAAWRAVRGTSRVRRATSPRHASPVTRVAVADSFRHSVHKSLACTTCHGTTSTHGGLKFTAPGGCIACHHSARQRVECTGCHDRASLPNRAMPMAFAISARQQTVARQESFTHERHATLACTRCHGEDVKRSVATSCASCHADHHGPGASCVGCHPTARTGHDRASHEGCARCHNDPVVAALPPSRPVCVVCHEKQRDHYPNGDCATCHATAAAH